MLPIQPEHNYSACGGPSGGCGYCIGILTESGERGHARILAENAARGLRAACAHGRAAEKPRTYESPDPYGPALKKLAPIQQPARWPDPPTPSSSPKSYTPPDPYTPHLKKEHR